MLKEIVAKKVNFKELDAIRNGKSNQDTIKHRY